MKTRTRPLTKNAANLYRRKRMLRNVFCATGMGGGVDPSCGSSSFTSQSYVDARGMPTIHLRDPKAPEEFRGFIVLRKRPDGDYETHKIEVHEDFQRLGLGTRLYKEAAAIAKAEGKSLKLSEDVSDEAKAVHRKLAKTGGYNPTTRTFNARRKLPRSTNPGKVDPTRTTTMRAKMASHVKRVFAILRGRIIKLVVDEDAFGLVEKSHKLKLNVDLRASIDKAAKEADPNPTEAQVESGNYRKGHVSIQGLPIAIETAAGELRKGKYRLTHHYGYIKRTESEADGDHVDVFIGENPESEVVFIVDQYKLDGGFDEHKCMLGFLSTREAKGAYLSNYSKDWKGFGGIRALTMYQFKEWLEEGNTSSPIVGQRIISNVFCPTGEGGGVDPTCGGDSEEAKAVETLSKGILAQAKATLDKIPGAKWLREKSKIMYDKLVNRYGKKVAVAVVASGQAISWGAFGLGAAAGIPIWIPSALATAPGAALAELHYRIKGKGKVENEEEPDPVLVARLAREMVDELEKEWETFTTNAPPDRWQLTTNASERWRFNTTSEKVKAFQSWLRKQMKGLLVSKAEEELWNKYIESGLRKGAGRAFDDVSKPYAKGYAKDESTKDFYTGSKEQFLRDSFRQPVAKEKVKLLAGRTFDDLVGVTEVMSTQMTRTLTDALVQGKGPREVARDLNKKVDGIGQARALTISRTELIRAHAEGQLTAMELLGVEEVGIAVEWHTSHRYSVDKRGNPLSPCELCIPMEGVILKLSEAHGMIPRHPNCMCSWIPANVGEDQTDQVADRTGIREAIRESVELSGGIDETTWEGADASISRSRPESILNALIDYEGLSIKEFSPRLWHDNEIVFNRFCATGQGGGIDPSCGKEDGTFGSGTKVDPFRVGDDIKLAAKLLSKGMYIQLSQPEQISTLTTKLAKIIRKAEERGEKAPKIDMCKVSVPNTNLFCQETKGIPRIKMPQMRGIPEPGSQAATKPPVNKSGKVDIGEDFINHLKSQGIEVEEQSIRASNLRASQNEIDGGRVIELVQKVRDEGKDLRERPIFVTRDNYILDGHHHWAALTVLGADKGKDYKVPVYKLDIDIGRGVTEANDFAKAMGIKSKTV